VVLETSNIGEVRVVGVAPGGPEYLTVETQKPIEGVNYVAGFKQACAQPRGKGTLVPHSAKK